MKTTQAWGWLTAGVLALGLNGLYQDVGAQWAHRMVAEAAFHANTMLAPLAGRVDQFLTNARMVAARHEAQSCRLSSAVARIQSSAARAHSGIARVEAMSAREQAQLARLEANRARIEAQVARAQFANIAIDPIEFNAPSVHVNCPRVRVIVPQLPVMMKPVRVETTGTGPI